MGFDLIGLGTTADDGTGSPARTGGTRINALISAVNAGQAQGFKNRVRNGDFGIAQRGTSFSSPADGVYTLDGWRHVASAAMTPVISQQSFAAGQTDVPGEPSHYLRWALTGTSSGNPWIEQRIENVRQLAEQTGLLSFWIKGSRTENLSCRVRQNFGSGGSSTVTAEQNTVPVTTGWQLIELPITMPSISGKTIGTSSYITVEFFFGNGISAITTDLADVQFEPCDATSPKATPFERLPAALQTAWCQRYFVAKTVLSENGSRHIPLPPMRATPTVTVGVGSASGVNAAGFELSHSTAASCTVEANSEL